MIPDGCFQPVPQLIAIQHFLLFHQRKKFYWRGNLSGPCNAERSVFWIKLEGLRARNDWTLWQITSGAPFSLPLRTRQHEQQRSSAAKLGGLVGVLWSTSS